MLENCAEIFNKKHPFTVGVEEEYMLCNSTTGNLVNIADKIFDLLPESELDRFSYELILSEIEMNTPICNSVNEALEKVVYYRQLLREIGQKVGFVIGISGTHPTAKPEEQQFVKNDSYNWVSEQLGYYAQRNMTFATHVHVAVPNAETAIHVTNAMRRWIAPIVALTTNSPFFEGQLTTMKSSRTMQFGVFPRTNIPQTFSSFDEYSEIVNNFIKMKSIEKPRQIWWKIRPHMDFGTVEFRMPEVQRSLSRTKLVIALAQSLIHTACNEYINGNLEEDFSMEYLHDALWKASRFSFNAFIMDPVQNKCITMSDTIKQMLNYANDSLHYFGNEDVLRIAHDILENGTEADHQLEVFKNGNFKSLKQYLISNVEYAL
jgi:carboxylate-amine ligase